MCESYQSGKIYYAKESSSNIQRKESYGVTYFSNNSNEESTFSQTNKWISAATEPVIY